MSALEVCSLCVPGNSVKWLMIEREVFNLFFSYVSYNPVLLWSTERVVVLGGSLKGEMAFLSLL